MIAALIPTRSQRSWATACKTRTWIKNATNAGVGCVGTPTSGRPKKGASFESGLVTYQEWFHHFALGMRWRIGEKKFQNEALTLGMVIGLSNMLDEAWRSSRIEKNR